MATKVIAASFILSLAWLVLPEGLEINPYPATEAPTYLQTYYDYGAYRFVFVVMAFFLWRGKQIPFIMFAMFVLYLIDYFISYNAPYLFYLGAYGFERGSVWRPDGLFFPISFTAVALLYCGYEMIKDIFKKPDI